MNLQVIDQREVLSKDFKIYGDLDNPLFLAKDVAKWIEHSDNSRMLDSIDDDEKLKRTIFVSGQNRKMWFLTEDGLYEVLMQSRKPIAKKFKKEVKKILKDIRKHGAYLTNEKIEEVLLSPDTIINLATQLKEERSEKAQLEVINSSLQVQNQIMEPKARYFDDLVDRNLLMSFRDTAKVLKVKEKTFIQFLLDKNYVYRDKKGKLIPRAEYNGDLFEVKETMNQSNGWKGVQTLITPRGRETFNLLVIDTEEA